jgi:hypothetical protein
MKRHHAVDIEERAAEWWAGVTHLASGVHARGN